MNLKNDTPTETLRFLISLLIPNSQADTMDGVLDAVAGPELTQLLSDIAGLDRAAATAEVAKFEREHPELFGRLYDGVLVAHYSAAGTQEQVRELANRGPREPSTQFDPPLLDRVIATQAGKRRL
ncbi:hypothetical protein [Devosia sp. 919]|uniref:hypothetical protein n=1 Tax=Devosia sp. 919 TaxID=2726065 RepID=UPI0015517DE7|nr:hypothetical protein [Devosia sp. 919]